jgi:hypothetical protein
MKAFTIEKTEKNLAWVNSNLDQVDYKVLAAYIAIYYNHEFQKKDILSAIN